jgi:hypothetical protein
LVSQAGYNKISWAGGGTLIHIAICDDEKFVLHVLLIIPQQVRGELL